MKAPFLFAAIAVAMVVEVAHAQSNSCPAARQVVDIRGTTDPAIRRSQRDLIKRSLAQDNTIVRLGPDVDLDFSDLPASFFPIFFGRCVTLTSVASFDDVVVASPDIAARPASPVWGPSPGEARTPHSPGPVLRYG